MARTVEQPEDYEFDLSDDLIAQERLPELTSHDRAGAWLNAAGRRYGLLMGSLRYRVLCP